ncbi:MAG: ComEC/Rec2 family competence protein, partial [Deltaproteobacteria bacterium]
TTDAYRDSGLVHILSISGLHMAIMAGAVFATIRFLLAAIPLLALTQPIKKWAAAGGATAAILYYTISGGSAATLRSAIMMVVIFLAVMLGRPAIAMRNVAMAALLILALFPESLLDAGFQMSFAAVAALMAAYEATRRLMARRNLAPGSIMRAVLFLGGILFSTVIAGLAVTPLSIYHFHAMQHYAPLANLAAVPICNLVVMPAALATLLALPFGLEAAPLWIMGWGLDAMGMVARYVAGLPGAVTRIPQVPDVAFALILAGGLWLVLWQQRWRLAGLPLILAGFAASPNTDRPDLLVGREGALVAVRDSSGRLAAHADRPSSFELARWLEHDGDGRDPKTVRRTAAFRCDPLGCSTITGGDPLTVSRHPASIADDCDRAKILIVSGARPRACDAPMLVLDRAGLKMSGTVALHRLPNGTYEMRSVADARGERPWSSPHHQREARPPPNSAPHRMEESPPARPPASITAANRSAAPASVAEALEDLDELRSDVDEDGP